MGRIKDFDQWVKEDFSQVASTPGMGDVVAPTATSTGSGDQWPSLGAPYSLVPLKKTRKKRRKKKSV
jgi:hypothetical protein